MQSSDLATESRSSRHDHRAMMRLVGTQFASAAAWLALSAAPVGGGCWRTTAPANGVLRVKCRYPFDETVKRIKADIAPKGPLLQRDRPVAARCGAQIRLAPPKLLIFGNPPLGIRRPRRTRLASADACRERWQRLGAADRYRVHRLSLCHRRPRRCVQCGGRGVSLDRCDRDALVRRRIQYRPMVVGASTTLGRTTLLTGSRFSVCNPPNLRANTI